MDEDTPRFMELHDGRVLDRDAVARTLATLLMTNPNDHVREVAATNPGLWIRRMDADEMPPDLREVGGGWIEAYLRDEDGEPVVVGRFNLAAVLAD